MAAIVATSVLTIPMMVKPVNAQQLHCISAPAGLLSWWPAEGNADDIVGPNNGRILNEITFARGQVGQAFEFNGKDSFVHATSVGLPTGNGDRTLEMWVKVNKFVADEAFFAGYGSFGSNTQTYAVGTVSPRLTSFFSQWGSAIFGPSLQAGQWYHIAVTNVKNSVTLYVDGVAVGKRDLPINTRQGTEFIMGMVPGGLGDTRRLDGFVDEISVYNRALSQSEIQSIFNAGSEGKCKPSNLPLVISKAKIQFGKHMGEDTFIVDGSMTLPPSSNGIDSLVEDVSISVGKFSATIPSESFVKKCDNLFQFKGDANGIRKMKILKTEDGFQFKILAKNINLTDKVTNLVKIKLEIGDDKGSTNIRAHGQMRFN